MGKVLVLVAALLLVAWMAQPAMRLAQMERKVTELEDRLGDLKKENEELRQRIKTFYDSANVERLARERLGMVRKGERAFVIVPEGTSDASADVGVEPKKGVTAAAEAEEESPGATRDTSAPRGDGWLGRIIEFLGLAPE